jgi:hypothetical protein
MRILFKVKNRRISQIYFTTKIISNSKEKCPVPFLRHAKSFRKQLLQCGCFPTDYNFYGTSVVYSVGMSVPPLMIARIADDLIKQIDFSTLRIKLYQKKPQSRGFSIFKISDKTLGLRLEMKKQNHNKILLIFIYHCWNECAAIDDCKNCR